MKRDLATALMDLCRAHGVRLRDRSHGQLDGDGGETQLTLVRELVHLGWEWTARPRGVRRGDSFAVGRVVCRAGDDPRCHQVIARCLNAEIAVAIAAALNGKRGRR